MRAYVKAVLEVEEFILNADIADASTSETETEQIGGGGGGGGLASVGVEFEIGLNGNDEI